MGNSAIIVVTRLAAIKQLLYDAVLFVGLSTKVYQYLNCIDFILHIIQNILIDTARTHAIHSTFTAKLCNCYSY